MKPKPKTATSLLTHVAMPILSRATLIWFGFVLALILQDFIYY
jgi:hypothetical protein